MEHLDYLIRTLTYQRSKLELEIGKKDSISAENYLQGKIFGLGVAITEIYKLVSETDGQNF